MTLDEFLAWEREQDLRYEFDGVQPIAMTGGTLNHSVIAVNLVALLRGRLRRPCRVFNGDAKILVGERARYPDASVSCSPFQGRTDIVPEPVAVFEVLSDSTAYLDRKLKAAEYEATTSICTYVLIEQSRPEVTALSRTAEGWRGEPVRGLEATAGLPALGIELPLAALCEDVLFDT